MNSFLYSAVLKWRTKPLKGWAVLAVLVQVIFRNLCVRKQLKDHNKTDFQSVLDTQFPLVSFRIALLVIKYQTKV